jgi:hypothetical protein
MRRRCYVRDHLRHRARPSAGHFRHQDVGMTLRAIAVGDSMPLVAGSNFIRATRDAGYRSTSAAVAELIDNSIQAGAQSIRVYIQEISSSNGREISLAVQDDGSGMSPETLRRALQFGGTSRFGDRAGIGRYGMGLPNSSVSQARRLEVMSWQAPTQVWGCHLDVDELAQAASTGIPAAYKTCMPAWAAKDAASHGTLVVWLRCDRFGVKKGNTLAEKLRPELGRLYRRALWRGLAIYVNEMRVDPSDPLFAHPDTGDGGGVAFGPPLNYAVAIPATERQTSITVRFVELPIARWCTLPVAEKRSRRIVGGAGVSILRADREIDFGWHFMGGKRRENYDDWWRCEITFQPDGDELFGVTHTKQGITPSALLRSILTPDIESIARTLNSRARRALEGKKNSESAAASTASAKDAYLPSIAVPARSCIAFDHFAYRVRIGQLHSNLLFSTIRRGNVITVCLNNEHPFVSRVYASLGRRSEHEKREAIERLVIAAARARLSCVDEGARTAVDRFIGDWSDSLAAFSER